MSELVHPTEDLLVAAASWIETHTCEPCQSGPNMKHLVALLKKRAKEIKK